MPIPHPERQVGFSAPRNRAPHALGAGALLLLTLAVGCTHNRRDKSASAQVNPAPAGNPADPGTPPAPPPAPPLGILDLPLVEVPNSRDKVSRKVDFPELRRTAQYENLTLPKAPIFHPYHPLDFEEDTLRDGKFIVQTNLNLKLPETFRKALPPALQAKLKELGLGRGQVDLFCVSQDQPWKTPMLFRPHYWTDPEAPATGTHSTSTRVRVGLFETDPAVQFIGVAPGALLEAEISVHPAADSIIVSSPDNLQVSGFDPLKSQSIWSLTQVGDRAAVTLHLILNDADQTLWEGAILRAATLRDLLRELEQPALVGSPMAVSLKALFKPRVVSGKRNPTPEHPRRPHPRHRPQHHPRHLPSSAEAAPRP